MVTQKRNRGSRALTSESIETVRNTLRRRQWTQRWWAQEANVAINTVKRLLKGEAVELFTTPIEVLGLRVEDLTFKEMSPSIPLGSGNEPTSSQPPNPIFQMRSTFTDVTSRQIELAVEELQELLVGQELEINYATSGNGVMLASDFPESLRDEVELVLKQIHSLSEKCSVRGDIDIASK